MELMNLINLTEIQWVVIIVVAFLVGFSRTGISGITIFIIPILASVFGGKDSTGIILPILLGGDIFAVWYYHRHAEWKKIKRLLPWALSGIVLGALVGNYINDKLFKVLIAAIVLICLVILVYIERKGDSIKVPEKMWFFALTGIAAGFSSMIGNAAGPIFNIYLFSLGFKKNGYMGTTAWFFLIINFSKLPFQIFYWHNVTGGRLLTAAIVLPMIALGAFIGVVVIKKINEKPFRYIILGMTAITSISLFM